MSAKAIHLNLLRSTERLSSSPVRVKVLLPIVLGVILVAILGWWGFVRLQLMSVDSEIKKLRAEISANNVSYTKVCELKKVLDGREAELGQFTGYMRARRTWGETLAALAAMLPEGVQLTTLEIPEPPAQRLKPPPGIKLPPLLGPTNTLEKGVFRIAGRTSREETLIAFLNAVKVEGALTNNLVVSENSAKGEVSPRMRQFRQDVLSESDGRRAIVFDVEYSTPGRSFEP